MAQDDQIVLRHTEVQGHETTPANGGPRLEDNRGDQIGLSFVYTK